MHRLQQWGASRIAPSHSATPSMTSTPASLPAEAAAPLPWLLLAVAAVRAIFLFLTRWIVIGISRDIEFDLRNDLFEHLEALPYSYYQQTRTGDIMARATNDLNAVRMLLGPAIMYSANTIVFTAAALGFMLAHQPQAHFLCVSALAHRQRGRSIFWPSHS